MDQEYLELMENMLRFWLAETADISDAHLDTLNEDITNIHQAIEEGLAQPHTIPLAADLLIQTKLLSERRGHWHAWQTLIEKALTYDLPPRQATTLLNQLGFLCNKLSQLKEAIVYHQTARDLAQQHNLYDQWIRAEANLCNDYTFTHQYELGEQAGRAAVALCEEQQITNWLEAFSYDRLGVLYKDWGKPKEALPLLENAKDKFLRIEDQTFYGLTLLNISSALSTIGNAKEALALVQKAKTILAEINNESDVAYAKESLGVRYIELGQYDLSSKSLQEALQTFQKLNLPLKIANTATNLAECLTQQGKFTQANFYINISKPIFESLKDELNLANVYSILGFIHQNSERLEQAKGSYAHGLYLLDELPASRLKTIFSNELKERASQLG